LGTFLANQQARIVSRLPEGLIADIPDALVRHIPVNSRHTVLLPDDGDNPCFLAFREAEDFPAELGNLGRTIRLTPDVTFLDLKPGMADQLTGLGVGLVRLEPISLPSRPTLEPHHPFLGSDSLIAEILEHVSQDSVTSYIQRLQDFRTRYAYTESCKTAAMYLLGKFTSWDVPAAIDFVPYGQGTGMNVIATLQGKMYPERVNIICAHYDSYSESVWTDAPGADDDASGIAMVMEAARVMREYDWESTIQLIAFWGEEIGLVGSHHYADSVYAQGMDIRGLINFDMCAYRGDSLPDFYVFPLNSDTGGIADIWIDACTTYTTLHPIRSYDGYGSSDFYYFMQYGYPCSRCRDNHFASDNPNYHRTTDRIETLNLPYCTEVAKSAIATMAVLAGPYTTGLHDGGEPSPTPTGAHWSIAAAPNPFSSSTRVRLSQSAGGTRATTYHPRSRNDAPLGIYDLAGRRVRTLLPHLAQDMPGTTFYEWDGRDERGKTVPSGVYFAGLASGEDRVAQRLVFVR
jgi:hypothetical protein